MKGNERNGYTFMKQWFDFAYQNTEKVAPVHAALYFWLIQLNNSLAWKEKFSVPTFHAMEMLGIKNYRTYKRAFEDLQKWNFIKLLTKSTNQHTANVVALVKFTQANTKASPKQVQSTATIVKPIETIETFKTPKEGPASKIVELYFEIDGIAVNTDPEKNLKAAGDLLKLLEKNNPGLGPDEIMTALRQFFEGCMNISDEWLRRKMSLPTIVTEFNRIKKTLAQPQKGQGATVEQIAAIIADKFGSDSPNRQKPGTSPDLSQVDNYLNEQ